jgi:hypothetical protein
MVVGAAVRLAIRNSNERVMREIRTFKRAGGRFSKRWREEGLGL